MDEKALTKLANDLAELCVSKRAQMSKTVPGSVTAAPSVLQPIKPLEQFDFGKVKDMASGALNFKPATPALQKSANALGELAKAFWGMDPTQRNAILGALAGGLGAGGISALTGGPAGRDAILGALLMALVGGGGTWLARNLGNQNFNIGGIDTSYPKGVDPKTVEKMVPPEDFIEGAARSWKPALGGTGAAYGGRALLDTLSGQKRLLNPGASRSLLEQRASNLKHLGSGRAAYGAGKRIAGAGNVLERGVGAGATHSLRDILRSNVTRPAHRWGQQSYRGVLERLGKMGLRTEGLLGRAGPMAAPMPRIRPGMLRQLRKAHGTGRAFSLAKGLRPGLRRFAPLAAAGAGAGLLSSYLKGWWD